MFNKGFKITLYVESVEKDEDGDMCPSDTLEHTEEHYVEHYGELPQWNYGKK